MIIELILALNDYPTWKKLAHKNDSVWIVRVIEAVYNNKMADTMYIVYIYTSLPVYRPKSDKQGAWPYDVTVYWSSTRVATNPLCICLKLSKVS